MVAWLPTNMFQLSSISSLVSFSSCRGKIGAVLEALLAQDIHEFATLGGGRNDTPSIPGCEGSCEESHGSLSDHICCHDQTGSEL